MVQVFGVRFKTAPEVHFNEATNKWIATLRGWTQPLDDDLTTIEVKIHISRRLAAQATKAAYDQVKQPVCITI